MVPPAGNHKGRPPGPNRVKLEARVAASELVDDPQYREQLRQRLIEGTAGAMEPLLWFYEKGRPAARVEDGGRGEFAAMTNAELKERLNHALARL